MSDRIFGVVGILLSALFIWRATVIQESFMSDAVGPKTFPIIIGVMVGVAGLVIMLRPDPEPQWPALGRILEIVAAVVVMVAYAELLPEIGFVIATAIAAAFLSWRLGAGPIQAVIAGIAISAGIYVIFHLILGLSLARGPFGF